MKHSLVVSLAVLGLLSACQPDSKLAGRPPVPGATTGQNADGKPTAEGVFVAPKTADSGEMAPIKSSSVHAVLGEDQPVTLTLTCLDDVLLGIKLFRVAAVRLMPGTQILVRQNQTLPRPGEEATQPAAFANFNCKTGVQSEAAAAGAGAGAGAAAAAGAGAAAAAGAGAGAAAGAGSGAGAGVGPGKSAKAGVGAKAGAGTKPEAAAKIGSAAEAPDATAGAKSGTTSGVKPVPTEIPKNVEPKELKLAQYETFDVFLEKDQTTPSSVIVVCADREKFNEADKLLTTENEDKKLADLVLASGSKILMMTKSGSPESARYVMVTCTK